MDLEKEEGIDLGKLWQVTKAHKKVVGGIIVGCTAIATITAFVLPKQYESTTLVQTRSARTALGGDAASMIAAATGTSTVSPTNNYMELMKSRTVLDPTRLHPQQRGDGLEVVLHPVVDLPDRLVLAQQLALAVPQV